MTANLIEARVQHRFAASPERVFDAWLKPELVRKWSALPSAMLGKLDVRRVEIDARVGGRFTFSDMRAEGEAVHSGTYLEIDRPRRLVFTWFTSEEEEASGATSIVTLALEPDGEGCLATITHAMDAEWAPWVPQTAGGWGSMLGQIAGMLAGEA